MTLICSSLGCGRYRRPVSILNFLHNSKMLERVTLEPHAEDRHLQTFPFNLLSKVKTAN